MFYFIKDDLGQNANWEVDFQENLIKGLYEIGTMRQVAEVALDWVPKMSETDYVFVVNYKHLSTPEVMNTKATVLAHSNGSAVNYYAYNVNKEEERRQVSTVIDVNTTNCHSQDILMNIEYPEMNPSLMIGFPLDFEKYKKYNKPKKKKIVVGGRISPDKQFYLATYLLSDLVKDYEVVFTVIDKDHKWSDMYDLDRFRGMGYRIKDCLTSEEFYEELSDAEFFFICSLGDTISVGLAEAILCGCYPVVPDIQGMFPLWMDYVSKGYEPFSKKSVEKMIRRKPSIKCDMSLFDYKKVCQRLKEGLSL